MLDDDKKTTSCGISE